MAVMVAVGFFLGRLVHHSRLGGPGYHGLNYPGSPQFLHLVICSSDTVDGAGTIERYHHGRVQAGHIRPQEGRQVRADHQSQAAATPAARTQGQVTTAPDAFRFLVRQAGLLRLGAPAQVAGLIARRVLAGGVEYQAGFAVAGLVRRLGLAQ